MIIKTLLIALWAFAIVACVYSLGHCATHWLKAGIAHREACKDHRLACEKLDAMANRNSPEGWVVYEDVCDKFEMTCKRFEETCDWFPYVIGFAFAGILVTASGRVIFAL